MYKKLIRQIIQEYQDKISKNIFRKILKKPWMRHREREIIETIIQKIKPMKSLEWGLGYGSLHFSQRVPTGGTWLSIEHEKEWISKVNTLVSNDRLTIEYIPPDVPYTTSDGDGTYYQFKSYIEFPEPYFDFILIDGRARNNCLKQAYNILSESGIVVLHDANRKVYLDRYGSLFKYQVLFNDYRIQPDAMSCEGGIWIGSKGVDLNNLLDIPSERKIWNFYNSYGRILRL